MSNIGAIGGTYTSPVLFVPQVAIGALGKTAVVPRYNADSEVVPTSIMQVHHHANVGVNRFFVLLPLCSSCRTVCMCLCAAHQVSWAGDHRVVDGATMARFSNLWKAYLQDPVAMLADMR